MVEDGGSIGVDDDPLFEKRPRASMSADINYECHFCGEAYSNTSSLADHVRRAHKAPPEPEPDYDESTPSGGRNGIDSSADDGDDEEIQIISSDVVSGQGDEDGGMETSAAPYKCSRCDEHFRSKARREKHAAERHSFACVCCRDSHVSRGDEGQEPGFCQVCSSTLTFIHLKLGFILIF